MSTVKEHDPLCVGRLRSLQGWHVVPDCICRELRTARLQGPVRENRHAPLCWCPECLKASATIHGTPA